MITRALLLLSLALLGAFEAPGIEKADILAMANNTCNNLQPCPTYEEFRNASLEFIKQQILNKLGMKHAPNMTGREMPNIPPLSKLKDLYEMQADQPIEPGFTEYETDDFTAKTESIYALAQPHPRLRHSKGNRDVIYFKFSDKVLQHRVTKAGLSLWLEGVPRENATLESRQLTIILRRILRGTSETGGLLLGPPLTTMHLRPIGFGGWITIEIRRMVAEWFRHPRDNLGVAVIINGTDNRPRNVAGLIEVRPERENAPFLEVQMQELHSRKHSRIKRDVGLNCDEKSQETRCCRYKLTVDFEKFGWDWIIAPKKYDANYCSGSCPLAFLPTYPVTHIISLSDRPNSTGPCCAPRKLSEITMLYFDNEYQIVFSRLPGMIIEKCGCS